MLSTASLMLSTKRQGCLKNRLPPPGGAEELLPPTAGAREGLRAANTSERVMLIGKKDKTLAKGVENNNYNQTSRYGMLVQELNT